VRFVIEVEDHDGAHILNLLGQNSPGYLPIFVRDGNGLREIEATGVREAPGGEPGPPVDHERPHLYRRGDLSWGGMD
jgi:hypothetical protein